MELPDLRTTLLFVLFILSAFFSGSETALFSFGRFGLSELKEEGHKHLGYFERLLHSYGRLLVTILLGNELVNVAIASISTSIIVDYFGSHNWKSIMIISVVVTTPLLLIIGEITPKAIAIRSPRQVSFIVLRPILLFYNVLKPFLDFIDYISYPLRKWLGIDTELFATINEKHFLGIVDASSNEQEIQSKEREIIHNIFQFNDKNAEQIMIPREQIFYVREDSGLDFIIDGIRSTGFSRVLVLEPEGFNVTGVLLSKSIIPFINASKEEKKNFLIDRVKESVMLVPKKTKLFAIFRMLNKQKKHMAVVVDEHGELIGLLTMEDLLEELFGEISDERDV